MKATATRPKRWRAFPLMPAAIASPCFPFSFRSRVRAAGVVVRTPASPIVRSGNVNENNVGVTVAPAPRRADAHRHVADVTLAPARACVPWSVWPLAGTTVGLMAVSLTHLSDGVTQLTAIPSWRGRWRSASTAC
jgi:hypothetical protein